MKPYRDVESDNKTLLYKRDLVLGRIYASRKDYAKAMSSFEKSWEYLDSIYQGEASPEMATLYNEMGETAELMKDKPKALEMFKLAYDTFMSLDMIDSAEMIAPKLAGSDLPPSKGFSPMSKQADKMSVHSSASSVTGSEVSAKSRQIDPKSPKLSNENSSRSLIKMKSANSSGIIWKPNTDDDLDDLAIGSD